MDGIALTNLEKPLLLQDQETQLISVNFDPKVFRIVVMGNFFKLLLVHYKPYFIKLFLFKNSQVLPWLLLFPSYGKIFFCYKE